MKRKPPLDPLSLVRICGCLYWPGGPVQPDGPAARDCAADLPSLDVGFHSAAV